MFDNIPSRQELVTETGMDWKESEELLDFVECLVPELRLPFINTVAKLMSYGFQFYEAMSIRNLLTIAQFIPASVYTEGVEGESK